MPTAIGDEGSRGLADTPYNHLGADRVGADQADRAVLLGRADRHDDAATRPKISIDLRPGLQLQLHCFGRGAEHDASEICRVENEL
jgi:hypothetical protein